MQRFRLSAPTIAIQHEAGKDVAVVLPEGAAICTPGATDWNQERSKLVAATWEGKPIRLFLADLFERGELVQTATGD